MAPVYYNGVDVTQSYLGSGKAFMGIPTAAPVLWTPAEIATSIWIDAADSSTVTLSGSVVTQWNDKSGNGNHYSQSFASSKPVYQTNVRNGLNAVYFDNGGGTAALLQNGFTYAGNTLHMYSVHINDATPSSATDFGRLFSFADNTNEDYANTAGILLTYGVTTGITLYRNFATIATTSAIDNTWAMVDAQRDAGTGKISLNGNAYTSGSTSTENQNIQRGRIGNDFAAADSGMLGYIAENIVLTYIPSDSDNEKIQGYLAWKWGLEGSLPAGHPYKNSPPYV